MSWKGQSSIEYLASYGWMVVAVGVAGAAMYPTVDMGCDVQIDENLRTGGITVEQAGITENGSFEVVLDSDTRQEIVVESIELESDEDSFRVVNPQTISPGGEKIYPIGQVERTGSCQDYNVNIRFDKGPLEGQETQLRIRGSMNLVRSFASFLLETGDSIPEIEINTSVQPTNDTICIGAGCASTTGESSGEENYVNFSGDEMTGTLETYEIRSACYGVKCDTRQGDTEGYLTTEDGQVNGTLNVTEIKPVSDENGAITFR